MMKKAIYTSRLVTSFLFNCKNHTVHLKLLSKLATVGVLEPPKEQGQYGSGQLFLHRVFGYRGLILFPWIAKVFDRDVSHKTDIDCHSTATSKEISGHPHTYYQVLIDGRDCPYIRAQPEAVTFLGNQENSRSLFAIPGLDYVAHEDVLPYISSEKHPISHDLFREFFKFDDDIYEPSDELRKWQEKNYPWLELSVVHRETTEGIRITVMPFYMGSRESQQAHIYWWRYCVRLENLTNDSVQLRERHWRIFSPSGTLETVRGRGVIGQEPIMSKDSPAFQYSSHVSLQTSSGHMWGTYKMEKKDGSCFDCRIPSFCLESKSDSPYPLS